MSKIEFAKIYNQKRFSLMGTIASDAEIDENYCDYMALVELTGRDGELHFMKVGKKGMTWDFSPSNKEAPDAAP